MPLLPIYLRIVMSEDQKPVAPAEKTHTSENSSQPEQTVAARQHRLRRLRVN